MRAFYFLIQQHYIYALIGSGWSLHAVYRCELQVTKVKSIGGGCGLSTVYDQKDLQNIPHALDGDDRRCFFRAIARHFIPSDDRALLDGFADANFDTRGFELPFRVSKIAEFELRNAARFNIKINVIFEEHGEYYPIFVSKVDVKKEHVNILLYNEASGLGGTTEGHYVYIADLGKLLRKKYRSGSKRRKISYQKCHVCPNCLNSFSLRCAMESHFKDCSVHKPQTIIMPDRGDCLSFKNFNKRFKRPLIGFFDFEAVMKVPDSVCEGVCVDSASCFHKTFAVAEQKAGTVSFVLVNFNDELVHSFT